MTHRRLRIGLTLAALIALPVASLPAAAEPPYPCKQIAWIVPFAAGGGVDRIARVVTEKLSVSLNVPIAVESRPGASGGIGAQLVANAAPDGCTLLSTSSSLSVSQAIGGTKHFDLLVLSPVIRLGELSYALAVNSQNGIQSIPELVARAKEKPGDIKYATSGRESVQSLLWAHLASKAGIQMTPVTYKGGGEQHVDMLANRVQLMATDLAQMRSYVEAKQVNFIGVTSPQRASQLPDVPAVAEFYPGFDVTTTYGVVAPPNTPPALVERLNREINVILQDPGVRDVLTRDALFDVAGGTPAEYGQQLRADLVRYRELAKLAGVDIKD